MDNSEFLEFINGVKFLNTTTSECRMSSCKMTARVISGRTTYGVIVQGTHLNVTVSKCSIMYTHGSTVLVRSTSGLVKLHDCEIAESKDCGVQIPQAGGRASLKRCIIRDHVGFGVLCRDGGCVVAERVHTERNKFAGYSLIDGESMKLTDCSSYLDRCGVRAGWVLAKEAPKMAVRRVFIRKSIESGMSICSGLVCTVVNCGVVQCGGPGFDIKAREDGQFPGRVKVSHSKVKGCEKEGVYCHAGGVATMKNVFAVGNSRSGFGCFDSGSELRLVQCDSAWNHEHFTRSQDAVMHLQGIEKPELRQVRIQA